MRNKAMFLQDYVIKENMTAIYGLPISEGTLGKLYFENDRGDKIYETDRVFYLSIEKRDYKVRYFKSRWQDEYYILLGEENVVVARAASRVEIEDPNSLIEGFREHYKKLKDEIITGQVNVQNHYLRYK